MRALNQAIFELWCWQCGSNPTNFTARLFDLIGKADPENRRRLAGAFPIEYEAWRRWEQAIDGKAFFKAHGIDVSSLPERPIEKDKEAPNGH